MADLDLFTGIDKATVRPFTDRPRGDAPFTAVKLTTDDMEVSWLLTHPQHLAHAAMLRRIADAIESGENAVIYPEETEA